MKYNFQEHFTGNRRKILWGIFALVIFFSSLFAVGLLALFWALDGFGLPHPPGILPRPGSGVFLLCLLPAIFLFVSSMLAGFGFRRIGRPLADFISASEAVGRGDLTVRLHEHGPGQIRRMARSFNQMVGELSRAEQHRRNMAADIAHELRTPLHVIQGNLEGMLDGIYEPNAENLTATLEETRLLARLVNDLQTLSLAEAGQLPLHLGRFPAADLLEDAAASFSVAAAEHGVEIAVQLDKSIQGVELLADYDRLNQVFGNLISNALRHTPPGGKISLSAESDSSLVRFSVADTGSGIPAEDLPYIFDRFWKGDRARTRGKGAGSGLGLAITRQLVRAHGGNIFVESQPTQGTKFIIEVERK